MTQGNICYRLLPNKNYAPGVAGPTGGPSARELPISSVYVAPGAATLDFYDMNGNRNVIPIASSNTGIYLSITVTATGTGLTGSVWGFSAGSPYGNM
jgi:hypothetical protein